MSWRLRTRWEPPRGCSTTGPHSHGSGRRPGSWLARVHTTPHQQALRLTAWRGAGAHTHHVLVATTTTPGSRLTSVVAPAHEMGTPKGLFHNRASLAWEREETRFVAGACSHHTTPTGTLAAWRGAGAHTHHVLVATTTTPGSRLTSVVAPAHEMGTPKGLFHNRASLAWEREETRFVAGACSHHTTPTGSTADCLARRRRTHPSRVGRYHHDTRL